MASFRCYNLSKTCSLYVAFFVLGISIAIPGPTLLDLMQNLNTDIATMSMVYVWRSSGYLVGSFLGGILLDRFDRTFLLFASLLIIAISMTSIPWFTSVYFFSAAVLVVGASTGFLDIGGNVLCLDLWGKDSGPFLQALHFSFGFGALAAPLLAGPFLEQQAEVISYNDSIHTNLSLVPLSDLVINFDNVNETLLRNNVYEVLNSTNRSAFSGDDEVSARLGLSGNTALDNKYIYHTLNGSELASVLIENFTDFTTNNRNVSDLTSDAAATLTSLSMPDVVSTTELTHRHVHSHKPEMHDRESEDIFDLLEIGIENYGLSNMHILYLIIGILVLSVSLIFLIFVFYNPYESQTKDEENEDSEQSLNKKTFIILVGLMSWFFFVYVGMEVAFGQLLLAYSVKSDLQLSKTSGSYLTATFWGSFSVMRFLAIFFSAKFNAISVMILDLVLCTLGSVSLFIFGNSVEYMLWIGTAMLGAGFASMFPTGILWLEKYIPITNKVASAFVVGAAFGEMVCPLLVGHFMDTTPMVLIYAVTLGNLLCIVTFIIVWLILSKQGERRVESNTQGQESTNPKNEVETIEMRMAGSERYVQRSSESVVTMVNGN